MNSKFISYKKEFSLLLFLPFIIGGFLLLYLVWLLINLNRVTDLYESDTILDLRYKNYLQLRRKLDDHSFVANRNSVIEEPSSMNPSGFRVVCYYVVALNLTGSRELLPKSIDPYLCTHIIVGFASVVNGTIQPKSPDLEIYKSVVDLKNSNPSLNVLLSVQDISSQGELARAVSSDTSRKQFAINALKFVKTYGFDGIDIDWEFPAWPDADLTQATNFTLLLQEFRRSIDENNRDSSKKTILSAAVGAAYLIMRQSYEIEDMAGMIDFVNVMSYDYHMYSAVSPLTGPNAPLQPRNKEMGIFQKLNTNWSATHWGFWGMPRSKINVGIPTYGHSFRLINADNNGWDAPASGFGKTGSGDGFLSYPDACKLIQNIDTTHVFDDEYLVPYAYNGDEWISYDNTLSVQLKALYVKNNRFGGAMIFCLNCDDFEGVCSTQKFPLTRTISDILGG